MNNNYQPAGSFSLLGFDSRNCCKDLQTSSTSHFETRTSFVPPSALCSCITDAGGSHFILAMYNQAPGAPFIREKHIAGAFKPAAAIFKGIWPLVYFIVQFWGVDRPRPGFNYCSAFRRVLIVIWCQDWPRLCQGDDWRWKGDRDNILGVEYKENPWRIEQSLLTRKIVENR